MPQPDQKLPFLISSTFYVNTIISTIFSFYCAVQKRFLVYMMQQRKRKPHAGPQSHNPINILLIQRDYGLRTFLGLNWMQCMTRLHVLPHTKLPQDCRVYILKHKLLEKVQSMERNREQAMLCWGGWGGGGKVFKEKKKK